MFPIKYYNLIRRISMSGQDSYNVERVHRVNIANTVMIVLLIVVRFIITKGISHGTIIGLQGSYVIALAIINYFCQLRSTPKVSCLHLRLE